MRYLASILAATFFAIGLPSVALADYSYTFTIPVQVTNLPANVTQLQVECGLYAGPNGNPSATPISFPPTSAVVAPTNGSFSGNFTVKASSPTQPGSYSCWLMVYNPSSNPLLLNLNGGAPTPGWQGQMIVGKNLP